MAGLEKSAEIYLDFLRSEQDWVLKLPGLRMLHPDLPFAGKIGEGDHVVGHGLTAFARIGVVESDSHNDQAFGPADASPPLSGFSSPTPVWMTLKTGIPEDPSSHYTIVRQQFRSLLDAGEQVRTFVGGYRAAILAAFADLDPVLVDNDEIWELGLDGRTRTGWVQPDLLREILSRR